MSKCSSFREDHKYILSSEFWQTSGTGFGLEPSFCLNSFKNVEERMRKRRRSRLISRLVTKTEEKSLVNAPTPFVFIYISDFVLQASVATFQALKNLPFGFFFKSRFYDGQLVRIFHVHILKIYIFYYSLYKSAVPK